jgi:hypothetical protein
MRGLTREVMYFIRFKPVRCHRGGMRWVLDGERWKKDKKGRSRWNIVVDGNFDVSDRTRMDGRVS